MHPERLTVGGFDHKLVAELDLECQAVTRSAVKV